MDGQSGPAVLAKVLGDVVCDTLRANEDKNLRVLLADLVEVLNKLRPLLELGADLNDLSNVVVGSELHGPDVHLDEILEEILLQCGQLDSQAQQAGQRTLASFCTSFGHVALNINV